MYGGTKHATSLAASLATSFSPSEVMPQRSSKIGRLRAKG